MAPGSAHFRVVAPSICLPLPPRAGRTPRPVDKLSGFFTEKKAGVLASGAVFIAPQGLPHSRTHTQSQGLPAPAV